MIPGLISPDTASPSGGHVDPDTPAGVQPEGHTGGWSLTMSEEFNGAIEDIDIPQGWVRFRDGGTVWRCWYPDYLLLLMDQNLHTGNSAVPERQYYSRDGVSIAAGSLLLTATAQGTPPRYHAQTPRHPALDNVFHYTSGNINSHPSFNQTYGFFEARMRLPGGSVQWPAFWLFPQTWDTTKQVELDVMECFAQSQSVAHSNQMPGHTVHMYNTNVGDVTAWHTYGMAWWHDRVEWYVDGALVVTETNAAAVPQVPMYPILNLATRPTSGTYPETMVTQVDHVRVWQAT